MRAGERSCSPTYWDAQGRRGRASTRASSTRDGRIAGRPGVDRAPTRPGSFSPSLAAAPRRLASSSPGATSSTPTRRISSSAACGAELEPAGRRPSARPTSVPPARRKRARALPVDRRRGRRAPRRLPPRARPAAPHRAHAPADRRRGQGPRAARRRASAACDRSIGEHGARQHRQGQGRHARRSRAARRLLRRLARRAERRRSAAYVDPAQAQPLWRKKFSQAGSAPVGRRRARAGSAQVVWFEGGKVMTAPITRDGVGPPRSIARVSGEQPPPSITAGAQARASGTSRGSTTRPVTSRRTRRASQCK